MCLSTLWFNPTPSKSHSKKNANDHNEFQLFFLQYKTMNYVHRNITVTSKQVDCNL